MLPLQISMRFQDTAFLPYLESALKVLNVLNELNDATEVP